MQLIRVDIKNFRSIATGSIPFEPSCRVLVGMNESGKSNALKALSTIAPDYSPDDGDVRFEKSSEPDGYVRESYVRFVFDLSESEIQESEKRLQEQILQPTPHPVAFMKSSSALTISEYLRQHRQILFVVDLKEKNKSISYWPVANDITTNDSWFVVKSSAPDSAHIVDAFGRTYQLKSLTLIHKAMISTDIAEHLAPATRESLHAILSTQLVQDRETALPTCVYWKYSESNLLPAQIPLESFRTNPESCTPLKNMFELAKINNISAEISAKQAQSPHQLRNLLSRVAAATTDHVRAVWPEYNDITINLSPDGGNIDASVLDSSVHFEFSRRSDGFKRLVTFLLMISAKVKAGALSNTLILIDEPEGSLHPSGARHLLRELIRVSESNHVVISTHSIFMIDKDCIPRHFIVRKEDGITSLTMAEAGNIVDEEVLYDAVGFSIFETLQARNILFEGWRDKRLFQVAVTQVADQGRKQHLLRLGRCHARGVKEIRSIAAFVELAGRQGTILSDSDEPARERQREYQRDRGPFPWKRYDEISKLPIVTSEDFIKPDAFLGPLRQAQERHLGLATFDLTLFAAPGGRLAAIKRWLAPVFSESEALKKELNMIKESLFDALHPAQIEESYGDVLAYLGEDANWAG